MVKEQYFAVVDLETTGSQFNKGDRIIQFGCALIQNGKIIQTYNIKINPMQKISPYIESLTGLSNKDVKDAVYFSDVAAFIFNLLSDCIFVAHNVHFDLRFLNHELEREGFEPLDIPAIDTVELSRILLPHQQGYSLSDLDEEYHLGLDQAHDAEADATATAHLFIMLFGRAKKLPLVTLERLEKLTRYFKYDTSYFLRRVIDNYPKKSDLDEQYIVVKGLALQKQEVESEDYYSQEIDYPATSEDKARLFDDTYDIRSEQEVMMNSIYEYFAEEDPSHEIAFEAPSGSGKTLGYLFPVYYQATAAKPIVISTYTTLLQQQFLDRHVRELEEVLPFNKSIVLLKSKRHYIDLEAFYNKLNQEEITRGDALYMGMVLVWLTETKTGDLNEIIQSKHYNAFFDEIRTKQSVPLMGKSKWADYNFYLVALKKAEHAAIIITNHAFLCQHFISEEPVLPEFGRLIIDEAHHFPEIAERVQNIKFSPTRFLNHIRSFINSESDCLSLFREGWKTLEEQNIEAKDMERLEHHLSFIEFSLEDWIDYFFMKEQTSHSTDQTLSYKVNPSDISEVAIEQAEQIVRVIRETEKRYYKLHAELKKYYDDSFKIRSVIANFERFFTAFSDYTEQFQQLLTFFHNQTPGSSFWLATDENSQNGDIIFIEKNYQKNLILDDALHEIEHIVYASATLALTDDNIDHFKREIHHDAIKFERINSIFDYKEQTRVYVPEQLESINEITSLEYEEKLAHALHEIASQTDEKLFVLFNSKATLSKVYTLLTEQKLVKGRTVLAQGISGSRNRILKNFRRLPDTILLGAGSFWEGIDLPGPSLRLMVITRLPFESPASIDVRARHIWLKEQGLSPFMEDSLPRAMMKFKQGFGRLIRGKDDKGVMIVLDDRIVQSSYATHFQKALPEDVQIKEVDLMNLQPQLGYFLDEK